MSGKSRRRWRQARARSSWERGRRNHHLAQFHVNIRMFAEQFLAGLKEVKRVVEETDDAILKYNAASAGQNRR